MITEMIELEFVDGGNSVFVEFPGPSPWIEPASHEGSWLLKTTAFDGEKNLFFGYTLCKAKSKTRGGGTYPVTWRNIGPFELNQPIETPLSKWDKIMIIEQVPSEFRKELTVSKLNSIQ